MSAPGSRNKGRDWTLSTPDAAKADKAGDKLTGKLTGKPAPGRGGLLGKVEPMPAPMAARVPGGAAVLHQEDWAKPSTARLGLIKRLKEQGITSGRVLEAMTRIPRERFIDEALWSRAYEDNALPIGFEQTISQPQVVARMISVVLPPSGKLAKVLEVGTGCGYQAAVLSQVAGEVYSIERIRGLYDKARNNLRALRLPNVRLAFGDGYQGLPDVAPFDAIVVAAAAPTVPPALVAQLKRGGKLIIPVGTGNQQLKLIEKRVAGVIETDLDLVRFVPMLNGLMK
jgi:protein-L-isoaspartate(D-aspartate) O-methyltransferase